MAETNPLEQPEQWTTVGGQIAQGFIREAIASDLPKWLIANGTEGLGQLIGLIVTLLAPIGIGLAKGIAKSEDVVAPEVAGFAAAALSDVFGTEVSPSAFQRVHDGPHRRSVGEALGAGFLNSIKGQGVGLEPSETAAARVLGSIMNMSIEGWYQGWMFEFMSSLVPYVDVGKIEKFADLDDTVATALGFSRLSRRVVSPLLDVVAVAPLRWQTNKTYRPELLGPGEVARQVARGRWTREQGFEELARQGYSDERIAALLAAVAKFHSVADIELLIRAREITFDAGVQMLREQGYDQAVAETELKLERLKRIAGFERSMATAAIDAYADGRIDRFTLDEFTQGATIDAQEGAQLRELAAARRALRVRQLSSTQAAACVRAGILSMPDYRAALRSEGYDEGSVLALELLLRHELEEKRELEELRAAAAAERAEEKRLRDLAVAARKAEVEADRARRRRGSEADLERAVVRGLIPLSRYEEVLADELDRDTVAILLDLVEADRLAYVEQQQRADEARQRALRRNLDVGKVEQAVLLGTLTIEEFARHPAVSTLESADRDILVATLRVKKAERDEARAAHDAAVIAASRRKIDLSRFEQLVRRGVRTLAQYDALLVELGFEEPARAAMRELLQAQIADDARAAGARTQAEAVLQLRGLSLEQFRRSVLLGLKAPHEFERFLIDERLSADVQALLMAELANDLDQAEAARARRQQPEGEPKPLALPLATVRRAARLGVVSPPVYLERLRAVPYSDDDIALELELLLLEIADVQAQRAGRAERSTELATDETLLDQEAQARRETIAGELKARNLSLSQLEEAVHAELMTVEDFFGRVRALGYGDDDAQLLVMLLVRALEKKADKAGLA